MMGAAVSQESLADGLGFVGNYLPVPGERLAPSSCVAGASMTIADIALLSALEPSEACEMDLSGYIGTWIAGAAPCAARRSTCRFTNFTDKVS
jgi:hypothetical protein